MPQSRWSVRRLRLRTQASTPMIFGRSTQRRGAPAMSSRPSRGGHENLPASMVTPSLPISRRASRRRPYRLWPNCWGDALIESLESEAEAAVILHELFAERGGRKAFTAVGLAAARALALVLVSPSPSPTAIGALTELLPPVNRGKPLDLRLLTDSELDFYGYLVGRASGEQPPTPTGETCTVRELYARVLASLFDRIDAGRCYADDDERSQLRRGVEVTLDLVQCASEKLWTEVYVAEFLRIRESRP